MMIEMQEIVSMESGRRGSGVVLNWLPRFCRNSKLYAEGFGKGLVKAVLSIQKGATTTSQMGIVSPR